jgi:SAM-dependent methyltransferase
LVLSQLFDAYDANYRQTVQSSIDFSGLPHDFFLQAKADWLARALRQRFGRAHAGHLLDVGCGIGALHPYLAGLFNQISGVDISAACVEEAKRRYPNNSYAVAAPGAPLPDGRYDVALAVCTLHHVPPADWRAFVAEMVRVTRPGGLVCLIEHNPLNPLTRLAVHRCPFDADAVLLRSGQAAALLRGQGAKNIETRFVLLLPSKKAVARRFESWLSAAPLGAQYLTCGEV